MSKLDILTLIWSHPNGHKLMTRRVAVITYISQIPQCTSPISHNEPLCNINVHMREHFCYKIVHCGIWDWCIVGFAICASAVMKLTKVYQNILTLIWSHPNGHKLMTHRVAVITYISQIPQCTSPISHNEPLCNINVHIVGYEPVPYPTMNHFVT